MLVTAIGLALVVVAAFFVAWPMLAPGSEPLPADDPAEASAGSAAEARAELARRRDTALAALKEAEFDHQVGKLSDEDHAALRGELEARALAALAALDAAEGNERRDIAHPAQGAERDAARSSAGSAGAGARSGGYCAACGQPVPAAARFCAACGAARPAAPEPSRRRA